MTAKEIGLELIELVGRNSNVGELSEPGIDPVDRLARSDGPLDQSAALQQRAPGFGLDRDPNCRISGDPDYVLDYERLAVQNTGWLGHRPKLTDCPCRFNPRT
jgi:hypothetical protein